MSYNPLPVMVPAQRSTKERAAMPPTAADEKCLALYYAYAALARALCKSGALSHDELLAQLAGANQQLHAIGETEAARFLGAMAQNLLSIDD